MKQVLGTVYISLWRSCKLVAFLRKKWGATLQMIFLSFGFVSFRLPAERCISPVRSPVFAREFMSSRIPSSIFGRMNVTPWWRAWNPQNDFCKGRRNRCLVGSSSHLQGVQVQFLKTELEACASSESTCLPGSNYLSKWATFVVVGHVWKGLKPRSFLGFGLFGLETSRIDNMAPQKHPNTQPISLLLKILGKQGSSRRIEDTMNTHGVSNPTKLASKDWKLPSRVTWSSARRGNLFEGTSAAGNPKISAIPQL